MPEGPRTMLAAPHQARPSVRWTLLAAVAVIALSALQRAGAGPAGGDPSLPLPPGSGTGGGDGGTVDAGAGAGDAGRTDAGAADGGTTDAGTPDGGSAGSDAGATGDRFPSERHHLSGRLRRPARPELGTDHRPPGGRRLGLGRDADRLQLRRAARRRDGAAARLHSSGRVLHARLRPGPGARSAGRGDRGVDQLRLRHGAERLPPARVSGPTSVRAVPGEHRRGPGQRLAVHHGLRRGLGPGPRLLAAGDAVQPRGPVHERRRGRAPHRPAAGDRRRAPVGRRPPRAALHPPQPADGERRVRASGDPRRCAERGRALPAVRSEVPPPVLVRPLAACRTPRHGRWPSRSRSTG